MPFEFLIKDTFTQSVYYYQADIPLADQLSPGSGAYKYRKPTITWTTPYLQSAFQVYVFNGTTQVHTSGKINSDAHEYRIPSGVINRDVEYRIYVTTWDTAGRRSWHSSSITYTWDPRSYVEITPVEDADVSSSSPNSNYGSDATMYAYVNTSYSPNRIYEAYLKFDLSQIPISGDYNRYGNQLILTAAGSAPTATVVRAHEVDSNWSESDITWNTRPAGSIYTHSNFTVDPTTRQVVFNLGTRMAAAYRVE